MINDINNIKILLILSISLVFFVSFESTSTNSGFAKYRQQYINATPRSTKYDNKLDKYRSRPWSVG